MSDNKAPVSQEKLSPVSAEKSVLTPIGSPEAENKSNVSSIFFEQCGDNF